MSSPSSPQPSATTLGLLAGGRATRLGGRDKAWMQLGGTPQVARIARAYAGDVAAVLVSANGDPAPYEAEGLRAVRDRHPRLGPLGGLDALAAVCTTSWLLTLPVDIVACDPRVPRALAEAAGQGGASVVDDDGPQPLAALWRVAALRAAIDAAIGAGDLAVHTLQRRLGLVAARIPGLRLGNLNTPADLRAAGMDEGT